MDGNFALLVVLLTLLTLNAILSIVNTAALWGRLPKPSATEPATVVRASDGKPIAPITLVNGVPYKRSRVIHMTPEYEADQEARMKAGQ